MGYYATLPNIDTDTSAICALRMHGSVWSRCRNHEKELRMHSYSTCDACTLMTMPSTSEFTTRHLHWRGIDERCEKYHDNPWLVGDHR